MDRHYLVYAGSYGESVAQGIHALRFDAGKGTLSLASSVSGIANPSFLTLDRERMVLFAVSECRQGAVVSYAVDPVSGGLAEIGRQPSGGAAPCHLALDRTGRWLAVAHYDGGSVCLLPVGEDGAPGPRADLVRHEGHGADPRRQEAPHPHSANPDPYGECLLVPDLGTDQVYAYRLDEGRGNLAECARTPVASGTGPRLLAFHPRRPIVYLIGELDCTVTAFAYDPARGALEKLQALSTLAPANIPAGDSARHNTAAHIATDAAGRFLYASNRGDDSISTFLIGVDGTLSFLASTPCGGRTPRHFCLVHGTPYLLAALQDSDAVAVMKIGEDGVPHLTGHDFPVARPTCLEVM